MDWYILAAAGRLVVQYVCIPSIKKEQARNASFQERFPPISDDQFMALCAPGTRRDVALTVRRTLTECLAVDYERIHPSARLAADLGAE